MKNKENTILVILVVLLIIVVVSGVTFAAFTWQTQNEQNKIIAGTTDCFKIQYSKGEDIGSNENMESLLIGSSYEDGLSTTISIAVDSSCGVTEGVGVLYLNTENDTSDYLIDNELLNYEVLVSNASVGSGTVTSKDSVAIYENFQITTTPLEITVYVWLNGENVTTDNLEDVLSSVYKGNITAAAEGKTGGSSLTNHNGTIPTGGTYVTGATVSSLQYAYTSATTYSEGESFPTVADGDKYTYGDYTYVYNATSGENNAPSFIEYKNIGGWLVKPRDNHNGKFGTILEYINGMPVKSMKYFAYTLFSCGNNDSDVPFTTAPIIPSTITDMSYAFSNAFGGCSTLTGTIRIESSNVTSASSVLAGNSNTITLEVPAGSTTYNTFNSTTLPANTTITTYVK